MFGERVGRPRRDLIRAFHSATAPCNLPGVDWVSFQPGPHQNSDQMVAEGPWDILGQRWLFLAICDGYGGPDTARFVADALPQRLLPALALTIRRHCGGLLDRKNCEEASPHIADMLRAQIVDLDYSLMGAVQRACPKPKYLASKEYAMGLIREHASTGVFARAAQGSTLAMAIIAIEDRFMWVAGVGNSTVALSTVDHEGTRRAKRLCTRHTFGNPEEFQRVLAARALSAHAPIDSTHPLLRWSPLTRVIGHVPLKMEHAYMENLFRHVHIDNDVQLSDLVGKIRLPSYLTAEPEVHFVDLKPVWGRDPVLLLFTEGVDHLVDDSFVFNPGTSRGVDTLDIVPALLSDSPDSTVEAILGHDVLPRWSGAERNRAFDVLGNLLGGRNTNRLREVLQKPLSEAERNRFVIRDTSLIIARFLDMR
ncbi:protein serine/threonine phosphatase 2C [Trametes versicolor FP-101664 SS1]|uniref:protein serine/threonine phosphatase 2C n=1 Tax=Trametes versicolor (strain FP-101664) TaxID=717944 RepID=UPI0004623D0D|nr:protein serine/threonine phosphatase 2C [Trametes versicolor FP-101664 SS1]EIW57438.1 protein serine/threonine phosphatase 2C [Trametes versicolor FP-101664 SS1]